MTTPPGGPEPTTCHIAVAKRVDDDMQVTFTCTGNEQDPCHQYPDCEFGTPCVEYTGDDAQQIDNHVPSIERSGLIDASYVGDYVEWDWAS